MTVLSLAATLLVLFACSPSAPSTVPGLVAPPVQAARAADFDQDHALWTKVLARHVQGDRFDYAALKAEPEELERYLDALHAVTPAQLAGWTKAQRFAFWINTYNAHTIKKVINEYPLKSIRELDKAFGLKTVFEQGFIRMEAHHPDGKDEKLSLNEIEHGILRARFEDARVHAAINCASISCPPLLNEAFVAARLDEQLDAQMKAFVHDAARNELDVAEGEARLSQIFDWFAGDFERDAGSVREYLARYAPELSDFLADAKLKSLKYDWDLNDVKR